jgi:hypothetical protein
MNKLWGWLNHSDTGSRNNNELLISMCKTAHARPDNMKTSIRNNCALAADQQQHCRTEWITGRVFVLTLMLGFPILFILLCKVACVFRSIVTGDFGLS